MSFLRGLRGLRLEPELRASSCTPRRLCARRRARAHMRGSSVLRRLSAATARASAPSPAPAPTRASASAPASAGSAAAAGAPGQISSCAIAGACRLEPEQYFCGLLLPQQARGAFFGARAYRGVEVADVRVRLPDADHRAHALARGVH